MRHHTLTPKLADLALHCNQGACNTGALLKALTEALPELEPFEAEHHPAIKFIIGHLSYLLKESCGPTLKACEEYISWRDATLPA